MSRPPGAECKRSKLASESSNSGSTGNENPERLSNRRLSLNPPDPFSLSMAQYRLGHRPPLNTAGVAGTSFPNNNISPRSHAPLGHNSPRIHEHYSPLSTSFVPASPRSTTRFDVHPRLLLHSSREQYQDSSVFAFPSSSYIYQHPPTTAPPTLPYGSHYQYSIELPSRDSFREPGPMPPLTQEDTAASSDSAGPNSGELPPILPAPDRLKALRVLPQPVPSGMVCASLWGPG